jgi:hypothetical protein
MGFLANVRHNRWGDGRATLDGLPDNRRVQADSPGVPKG